MRKTLILVLALLFTALSVIPAFANSAQVYWEEVPGLSVCTLDESTPVTVESEELSFNLKNASFRGDGHVTAAYEMNNPTDSPVLSQMVFPIISPVSDFSPDSVKITAGGENVDYTMYIGDVIQSEESFDLSRAISAIDGESYKPVSFNAAKQGTLYTFNISTPLDELELIIHYMPSHGIKVIGSGFFSFSANDDGSISIGGDYDSQLDRQLLLYAIGGEIDFDISANELFEVDKPVTDYECNVTEQTVTLDSFLLNTLENTMNPAGTNPETWLDYYYESLDRYFMQNDFASSHEVFEQDYENRTLFLAYDVNFDANETKSVSVEYDISATGDSRETVNYTYTYDYLLSPAKHWADFGSLKITVVAPDSSPYIVNSSIPFTNDGENTYTAQLDGLPDGELSFTLYSSPEIAKTEKITVKLNKLTSQLRFFLTYFWWIAALIVAVAAVIIIRKKKKRSASAVTDSVDNR